MATFLRALLLLCNNELACEQRVYQCLDSINLKGDEVISRELQSDVFQYCFENYVMEEKEED